MRGLNPTAWHSGKCRRGDSKGSVAAGVQGGWGMSGQSLRVFRGARLFLGTPWCCCHEYPPLYVYPSPKNAQLQAWEVWTSLPVITSQEFIDADQFFPESRAWTVEACCVCFVWWAAGRGDSEISAKFSRNPRLRVSALVWGLWGQIFGAAAHGAQTVYTAHPCGSLAPMVRVLTCREMRLSSLDTELLPSPGSVASVPHYSCLGTPWHSWTL